MNKCFTVGRFVADPVLRYTNSQKPVVSFTLAVERRFKNANGENKTDFFDFVAWNTTAEFISKYLAKGRSVAVESVPQTRDWTDKEGNKRRSIEFVVENITFADSKNKDNGTMSDYKPKNDLKEAEEFLDDEDDEELPF